MKINYLELSNYRKFKQLKLQFPDGIVGVLGLNGVGKSTLIESIAWALFGNVDEVVRTSRESVRRAGASVNESCVAILEFELGETEYRIHREMGGKSLSMKAEIRSRGRVLANGDKEVRHAVEKLLGMDHKSFFTSVFARQKELNALQNIAAGERKKVVLRMLRIDAVDDVLSEVRADRKEKLANIAGAERTLLTDDGRDKQKVLTERLPQLESEAEAAREELSAAEKRERDSAAAVQSAQARRDELSKDVDAFNSAFSDLKAKKASVEDHQKREKALETKLALTEKRLAKMPQVERDEARWREICEKRELLAKAKLKHERIVLMSKEAGEEERELKRRTEELTKAKAGLGAVESVSEKIAATEKMQAECQEGRARVSSEMGAAKSKAEELAQTIKKDQKKLDEITAAGKEGVCPTCERTLQEAYELLVGKLRKGIVDSESQLADAKTAASLLKAEMDELNKKEEALRKRLAALNQETIKREKLQNTIDERAAEIARLEDRLSKRKADLAKIGESKFSDQEYHEVEEAYSGLKKAHDEYVELTSLKAQAEGHKKDLEDSRETIKKGLIESSQYESIVKILEPKKALYDSTIKDLDEKMERLSRAKDELRKRASARERALAELDRTKKEVAEIERVKATIDSDRRKADELSLLEDVVSSFKDNLIARVAPALSDLTSKGLSSMTDGRYSKVELDDNYEMSIEDQGQPYPVDRFSGGEADLANLSLRLAISRIIADRTGSSPVNLLILDEIFGSQDPNRKRSVVSALSKLSNQFRQIFLITHIEDVKDAMNYVIQVEEQEDGTSTARLMA